MDDEAYMRIAISNALKGWGWTSPNPMVGALIVRDGKILAEGWHERYGSLHAERNALKKLGGTAEGATIYVTLEPCCHHGHQPPCTDAIIQSGIKRVVIGSDDPNPLVAGKGIKILREHGIEVVAGVLKAECDRINDVFFHYIMTKRPFVVLKYAMTMDGKIAAHTGLSKWITGEKARERVHRDRARYRAIMVGVNTVIKDDPLLTCRIPGGRNPIRIILDTHLRTPLSSQIATTAKDFPTIIATAEGEKARHEPYEALGCQIMVLPEHDGYVDLWVLMERLGSQEIDSVMIEGGGTVCWQALKSGAVNKLQAYIAPKILGGRDALTPVEGEGVNSPDDAFFLKKISMEEIEGDILIESEVVYVHRDN